MDIGVEVHGLREFNASLDDLESSMSMALLLSGISSAEIVVRTARPAVPYESGAAAGSLKVEKTDTGAFVVGGSNNVPYYAWLEFGGRAGINGSVVRSTVPDGRYINPAYLKSLNEIEVIMEKILTDTLSDSGLDVT